jgi:DNA mismatch endonuclease (patch repair protein)
MPSSRQKFWKEKFAANKSRDKKKNKRLLEEGWRVLVVWECALKGDRGAHAARTTAKAAKWIRRSRGSKFAVIGD